MVCKKLTFDEYIETLDAMPDAEKSDIGGGMDVYNGCHPQLGEVVIACAPGENAVLISNPSPGDAMLTECGRVEPARHQSKAKPSSPFRSPEQIASDGARRLFVHAEFIMEGQRQPQPTLSEKTLIARINRKLAGEGQKLCKTRGSKWRSELGEYHVIDMAINTIEAKHVDPKIYGLAMNVLGAKEVVID